MLFRSRQLELDFARGRTTLEALLSKYAPPGENDTAAYIGDVAGQMHVGARQALSLHDPAVLSNLMNAMIHHEQAVNPYSPEQVRGAAQEAVNSIGSLTFNNAPVININGAQDTAKTKQAVTDALADSYRHMTRNLQRATR